MKTYTGTPSKKSQDMLAALQQAVNEALEKKKKLGQYSVVWQENRITYIGDDTPKSGN